MTSEFTFVVVRKVKFIKVNESFVASIILILFSSIVLNCKIFYILSINELDFH